MSRTRLINTKFCFDLPFWAMGEEFSRPPRVGEHLDRNVIEDALFDHPDVTEVCLNHQCWVEFETTVPAHKVHDTIELAHQFVERTLKTFNKERKK